MELIKRGDIYWINFAPIEGSEIEKTRPAIIISNNINNELADTVTVIPITSSVGKVYPFGGLQSKNKDLVDFSQKAKENFILYQA